MPDNWIPWFAWYPVRVGGYNIGPRWFPKRWAWLRQLEWAEGAYIGERIYLDPTHFRPETAPSREGGE